MNERKAYPPQHDRNRNNYPAPELDVKKLNEELKNKGIKIFDGTSINPILLETNTNYANKYANAMKGLTSTQLRKFYSDLSSLEKQISEKSNEFTKLYPSILMLKSKVAYAVGKADKNTKRGLEEFKEFMDYLVDTVSVNSQSAGVQSFSAVKTFFEAIVGYHRFYNPK